MTDSNSHDDPAKHQAEAPARTSTSSGVLPPPSERRLQRVLLVLIILACVGVTSLLVLNVLGRRDGDGGGDKDLQSRNMTPTLFDQPLDMKPYELTDQNGEPFGTEQLAGKIYVAHFFFSTCPTMCPRVLAHTRELQAELRKRLGSRSENIRIISISVDPEKDTPAKLRETADLWDANPDMWRFLTGTREQVWRVVDQSFRHGVSANPSNTAEPIIHSPNYVLVDTQGRIRGFYDGLVPEKRSELLRDLLRLAAPDQATP